MSSKGVSSAAHVKHEHKCVRHGYVGLDSLEKPDPCSLRKRAKGAIGIDLAEINVAVAIHDFSSHVGNPCVKIVERDSVLDYQANAVTNGNVSITREDHASQRDTAIAGEMIDRGTVFAAPVNIISTSRDLQEHEGASLDNREYLLDTAPGGKAPG